MNLSFILSGGVHIIVFIALMLVMQPTAAKTKATYTIDFIGTAAQQPARYGEPPGPAAPAPQPTQQEVAKPVEPEVKTAIPTPKKEVAKPKKADYNSAEQIAKKAKKTAKKAPPPKPEPPKVEEKVKLSKPSILGEVQSSNIAAGDLHNLGAGTGGDNNNTVRASFTNFPYPWYITQVRNALWREWAKRMPKNTGLSTLVSFNIDKYGAVYSVQVERGSGNDAYDYAATSSAANSAPYPPLPKDFPKDILTVTVEFKNEE